MTVEWYTPADVVDAVRAVLGYIDLDPASSAAANEVVRAERFFTEADDGLAQQWNGRVFLNPPWGSMTSLFVEKLLHHYAAGDVPEAILLCAVRTDARWFQPLFDHHICFLRGRIKFWAPGETRNQPPNGCCVVYLGPDPARFNAIFSGLGAVVTRVKADVLEDVVGNAV